jgi:hypothetical protein
MTDTDRTTVVEVRHGIGDEAAADRDERATEERLPPTER